MEGTGGWSEYGSGTLQIPLESAASRGWKEVARLRVDIARVDKTALTEPPLRTKIPIKENLLDFNAARPWAQWFQHVGRIFKDPVIFGAIPADHADDAAAAVGGIPIGGVYRTGSALKVRVT
jgi:hypothetical protein